jgi:hypothetical protein
MTPDPIPLSTDQPLPGLGAPGDVVAGGSELYRQTQRALAALHRQGLVDERHAGLMQLALELAQAIRPGEKAYGVAQCAAQLLAVFDKLMPDAEGGESDGWSELRAFIAGVDAAGGSPTVRDPS